MKFIASNPIFTCATGIICLFFWISTHASNISPSPLAPKPLPNAQMVGSGTLRFLGLEIYQARLWVRPGFDSSDYAKQSLALELRYARSFSADAIAGRSIKEMRRQADFDDAQAERWRTALAAALPSVEAGDEIVGLYTPQGGARFWHNGLESGHVADPQFARLFFGIWLSPKSSEPALRAELLALP